MTTAVAMNARWAPGSPVDKATVGGILRLGAARLLEAGVDSARLDSEVLLRHVLKLEQSELYLRLGDRLSPGHQERFERLLERRVAREPLAYITGKKEFWSLDFIVTPAVLIPRPETELLVELALDCAQADRRASRIRILDIGTGSGAIAVSLARHLAQSEVWGVDISAAVLAVAEANAKRHGVEKRMRFFQGDLFDPLSRAAVPFDFILANPPYIRSAELATLAPEIREWEPVAALDGGTDGLDYYRRIIAGAPSRLAEGGRIFLEIGSDLAEAVAGLFAGAGCYRPAAIYRDCAGRERVVMAAKGRAGG